MRLNEYLEKSPDNFSLEGLYVRVLPLNHEDLLYKEFNMECLEGQVGRIKEVKNSREILVSDLLTSTTSIGIQEHWRWVIYTSDLEIATEEEYEYSRVLQRIAH